jgi:hypothetical protein
VYDIGENGDLSVDAAICDNVKDLVATFRDIPNAKGSFATKFVIPISCPTTRKARHASASR